MKNPMQVPSERSIKRGSRFTRLKAMFARREDGRREFRLVQREDGLWVQPIPRPNPNRF